MDDDVEKEHRQDEMLKIDGGKDMKVLIAEIMMRGENREHIASFFVKMFRSCFRSDFFFFFFLFLEC